MENRKLITQAQFAREVGVTRGAISLAHSRQPPLVYLDEATRKIDPEHPINVAYKTNRIERTSPRQQAANLSKSINKELSYPADLQNMLKGMLQDMAEQSATPSAKPESEEQPEPNSNINQSSTEPPTNPVEQPLQTTIDKNPGNDLGSYDTKILSAAVEEKRQKFILGNLKIQKEQLNVAALSGELARRDHVETFIGIISGTISNYFLPLDFRLTATIMAICGITDTKTKLAISEAIAKETTAGLAQVKKDAEEFAKSLNPVFSSL